MRDAQREADMDDHVLAEVRKNPLEVLRVARRQYRGHVFIDIRTYYQDDAGTWQPTQNGITVSPDLWNDFMQALSQVEVKDERGALLVHQKYTADDTKGSGRRAQQWPTEGLSDAHAAAGLPGPGRAPSCHPPGASGRGERLQTAYGKSDVKSRSLKRALAELDVLRGHCSYSLVHEQANGRGYVGSEKPFRAGADDPEVTDTDDKQGNLGADAHTHAI